MRVIAEVGSVYLRCRRREEMGLFPRKGGCLRDVKPTIKKEFLIWNVGVARRRKLFPKLAIGETIKRFSRQHSPLRR